MVKISVIVPIFNGEFYIQEALDSLVHQTMINDIEVIMVDDGSTDNSKYIIDRYALNYKNFFAYHLENKGVTFARNFGIDLAKGEYIHLMDADDYLDCEAYEKLYDLASKFNHDVVMGNFLRFNSRRTWDTDIPNFIFENIDYTIENTTLIENNRLTWDMFIWNKLYKKSFLDENNIRFPYKNLTFQDNLFSIQVYVKANTVGMLNDYIYFWRARENKTSITQVISIKWANDRFEILNMVHNFVNENIFNEEVKYTKYLKWLNLDLPNLINRVKEFPKDNHAFLLENLNQITNLVPEEFFENLSSYKKVLFSMVKNEDWNDLLKFISYDLKKDPNINMDIDKKYYSQLNLNNDGKNEKLNANASTVSFSENNIKIKFNYSIPFIDMDEKHFCDAFLIDENNNDKIPIRTIENNELIIPISTLNFKNYKIKLIYESISMIKESYLKCISRNIFSLDNIYLNVYFDKHGFLNINKAIAFDTIHIEEINFDHEKIIFHGKSDKIFEKIKIMDILSFKHFEYDVDFNKNDFKFIIYYNDLLNAPVKKWELIGGDNSLIFNLKQPFEIYNDLYCINIKNYGNKIFIELNLYENLKKINELNNANKNLNSEISHLKKIIKKYESKK